MTEEAGFHRRSIRVKRVSGIKRDEVFFRVSSASGLLHKLKQICKIEPYLVV